MNRQTFFSTISTILLSVLVFVTQIQGQEVSTAKQKYKDRIEYNNFHKQMLELNEYKEQHKLIPKLVKDNHVPVKVTAVIDSTDGDDEKTLKGFICQQIGDNTSNVYEVSYDRATRKIISVKKTGEGEIPEIKEKDAESKKPATHAKGKKNKDDEDSDEDTDEDKPEKVKHKEKDTDDK